MYYMRVPHACTTCCPLTVSIGLLAFQARHFQVFSGLIVALYYIVDPICFSDLFVHINILFLLAISEFLRYHSIIIEMSRKLFLQWGLEYEEYKYKTLNLSGSIFLILIMLLLRSSITELHYDFIKKL
jgi:hypothetical protein